MSGQSVKESRGSYLADVAKELVATASTSSFDATTFFEKFELLADLPSAVSQLRKLVKRLAITGRLVPQQKDESTSGLLDKLVVERNQFLARHDVRRPHRIRPIKDNELRWTIPASWDVARICHVCYVQAGFAFKSSNFVQGESGTPIIRIRDITRDFTQANYVGEYRDEFLVRKGDCLVGMDGNFTVATWRGPLALLNQRVARLQWCSSQIESAFFALALQFELSELQGKKAYTTVDHLSGTQISDCVVPLPPLAEQKRIVAKVDELMGLCDRLEALEAERKDRHASLSRAALARFATAPTPTNLQSLFHESFDVEPGELRKSILSMAVRGSISKQEPGDEPADQLISRITKAKASLVSKGEVGKSNPFSLDESSLPFTLPSGWTWCTLDSLCEVITKGSSPKWQGVSYVDKEGGLLFITSENVGNYHLRKLDDLKYVEPKFNEMETRSILKRGDILMTLVGASIGRTAVYDLDEIANINQAVAKIRVVRGFDADLTGYLLHYLNSPVAIESMLSSRVVTAQPNISLTNAKEFLIPLPPLAE